MTHRRTYYAIGFADYAIDFHVLIVAPLLLVERTGSGAALFMVAASNWLAETVFEVPTGYLADKFGRSLSTAASFALRGIGFVVIATSHTPAQFVVGWVIVGIGSTMLSGALDAWAVDREQAGAGEVDLLLLRGQRAASIAMVAAVAASVAVGWVAYAAPFWVAGVAGLVLAPVVLAAMGRDTAEADAGAEEPAIASGRTVVREAFRDPKVAPLLGLGAVLTLLLSIPGVQWAPTIESFYPSFALIPLGTIRAAAPALRAGFNWVTEGMLARIGRHGTLVTLLAVGAGLLGVVAHVGGIPLVAGFTLFSALLGLAPVLIHARLNEVIDRPERRATILSLGAAASGLVTGLGLLLVGAFVADPTDRAWVWTLAAGALGGLAVIVGLRRGLIEAAPEPEPEVVVETEEVRGAVAH